ncbi:hypothetical protein SESBI_10000 [Sesbania bispinosa]|nr:hypothetical protein SESBI_10000 [Sesbania bispinosa]
MSTLQLVSFLRTEHRREDFHRVEMVVQSRDYGREQESGRLSHRLDLEKVQRIKVEEDMRKKEHIYARATRVISAYDTLLKLHNDGHFVHKDVVHELEHKVATLERENVQLKEMVKQCETLQSHLLPGIIQELGLPFIGETPTCAHDTSRTKIAKTLNIDDDGHFHMTSPKCLCGEGSARTNQSENTGMDSPYGLYNK